MTDIELFKSLHSDKKNCRTSDTLQMISLVISIAAHDSSKDYSDEDMANLRSMHYMLDVVEQRLAEANCSVPNCIKLFLAELGAESYVNAALNVFLADQRIPYAKIKALFPNGALRASVAAQLS